MGEHVINAEPLVHQAAFNAIIEMYAAMGPGAIEHGIFAANALSKNIKAYRQRGKEAFTYQGLLISTRHEGEPVFKWRQALRNPAPVLTSKPDCRCEYG